MTRWWSAFIRKLPHEPGMMKQHPNPGREKTRLIRLGAAGVVRKADAYSAFYLRPRAFNASATSSRMMLDMSG